MTDLTDLLRDRIAETGPIPVSEYMGVALGHAEGGYYMTRDPLGAAGDFTTAPEVSQMFGELVGLWCAVTWQGMGAPDPVYLVELGPGRGTLMRDALRAAGAVPAFREALRPHLVEMSPALREAQKRSLGQDALPHPPSWHDSLSDVPLGPTLLIANEFFDALPVRQYERTENGWFERLVDADPLGGFCLTLARDESDGLGPAPEGSVLETRPEGKAVATEIGERLAAHGGAALIVDYGHEASGLGDTLQAVREHAYAEVLAAPGEADLTAHVDFQALSEALTVGGATVYGPVPQGHFLLSLGLEARAKQLFEGATEAQQQDIVSAHHRLVHPDEMGVLFKVLAATAPGLPAPAGFEGA